ncbi:MAG: hypothetical protein H7Y86_06510 [Rhizobacter sp.]|nr:hypothetical protein [Ferruginibacter sp.]
MFLKQLYHYNKFWLAAFLLFILAFIYINFKWGYTASPVYQYGMFSGKYPVKDTQKIYQVYLNGEFVNPASLNFADRDMLFTILTRYKHQKITNKNIFETNLIFYNKLGLGQHMNPGTFQNKLTGKDFLTWFSHDLFYRLDLGDHRYLEINYQLFQWQQGNMIAVSESKPDTAFAIIP